MFVTDILVVLSAGLNVSQNTRQLRPDGMNHLVVGGLGKYTNTW